jgi:hypothetical protein
MSSNPKSNIWTLKDVQRARQAAVYPRGFFLEYLVVGAGGAGGAAGSPGSPANPRAGGGGGGGFLTNEGSSTYLVESGVTYGITIGAGGSAPIATAGSSGSNTIFNTGGNAPGITITAWGGGAGGGVGDVLSFGVPAACNLGGNATNVRRGGDGASGGGGGDGWHWGVEGGRAITATSPFLNGFYCACAGAQGYNGGTGGAYGSGQGGGGGGGASMMGCNWDGAVPQPALRGPWSNRGGCGRLAFTGIRYGGGGGGGNLLAPTLCGPDVGIGFDGGGNGGFFPDGNTSSPTRIGCNAAANRGGGGGGTAGATAYQPLGQGPAAAGGTGGSGVVVIRYSETNPAATFTSGNPTYTVSGGFRTYTFTASGSIVW